MKTATVTPVAALFGFIGVACFLVSSMASTILLRGPEPKAGPATIYPDSSQTPGASNPDIAHENIAENICKIGWSTSSVRPPTSVTNRIKTQTMKAYGFTDSPTHYELDHLISLQNGGCPDCAENLWPEAYGDICCTRSSH
jgi:hypothetical protein